MADSIGINRRQFLQSATALGLAAALPGCHQLRKLSHFGIPISVYLPGMQQGHALRGNTHQAPPNSERRVKVAILGSGAAGLFAAWRLKKSGRFDHSDIVIVSGPELHGNAAAGSMAEDSASPQTPASNDSANLHEASTSYPRGAHYLPLPSMASTHVRELLFDMGVIEANPYDEHPTYDETTLIHSPEDRLQLKNGLWQDGVVPHEGLSTDEQAQIQRFLAHTQSLQSAIGSDGRKAFCIPLAQSSADPAWRQLDAISFAAWLDQNHYTAPSLRWYLDYACRDDYGIDLTQTSAWAGLHYFAARGGMASNAKAGAVLTWPNGLNPLLQHMQRGQTMLDGMAIKIVEQDAAVRVDVLDATSGKTTRLIADHVICAMPLHVAARITDLDRFGFDPAQHLAPHAAWQVSNFVLKRFPNEPEHSPLAWDNVVYGSASLGFVNSTHQLIRVAKPERTVFTAYHAYAGESPITVRQRLEYANADELYQTAIADLDTAYGWGNPLTARRYIERVEITLRGHAMASPVPGFLSNTGVAALRELDGRILFAHSDLSGLSVFEEASWWGEQAAQKILRQIKA